MEVSLLFHKDNASPEAIKLVPLLSKRPRPAPVDSSSIIKCKCGLIFGMWNRKHHCRACGEVFCHECTKEQIIVPKAILGYLQIEGWWRSNQLARVCQGCKINIEKYRSCHVRLNELYISPPRLDQVQKETDLHALSYYLSTMRRIQYLFPSDILDAEQILFLKVNRDLLHNHSYWAIQLLKIGPLSSLDSFQRQDETLTLCTRNCRPSLHLGNAVDMVVCAELYSQTQKHALQMIRTATSKELEPYVPILVSSLRLALLEILIEKAKEDPPFANLLYWSLNVIGTAKATAFRENILLETKARGAINLRHVIGALDVGDLSLSEIIDRYTVMDPFDPLHRITRIQSVDVGKTHSKPIFIAYHTETSDWKKMMYKREDVRRDASITQLLRVLIDSLKSLKDPFPLISYNVIPISASGGLVEIVGNCRTLAAVFESGSMSNFLHNHNSKESIEEVHQIYRLSLAFWTIITYLFGIGDRHFDNIMVSEKGILFHVDYGFIFGQDPKPYSPQIKLDTYMIEGIGGNDRYEEFKLLCYQIFMILRQNMDIIYTLLLNLIGVEPRITEPFIKDHLSRVFFVGETDEEAKSHLEFIIDSNRDALSGTMNDYIHSMIGYLKR